MEQQTSSDEQRANLLKELERLAGEYQEYQEHQYHKEWQAAYFEEFAKNNPFFVPSQTTIDVENVIDELRKHKAILNDGNKNELALICKNIGNDYFKLKKYECAIVAYTTGILFYPTDHDLKASLYNNRSAVSFLEKTFQVAIRDCEMALQFKPDHPKVLQRLALLKEIVNSVELNLTTEIGIINTFTVPRKINSPKVGKTEKRTNNNAVIQAIKQRNVQFFSGRIDVASLKPTEEELKDHPVSLVKGRLHWPVYILYRDFGQVCMIEQFDENDRFVDHMAPLCDMLGLNKAYKKYLPDYLQGYFHGCSDIFRFNKCRTLKEILSYESFRIKDGTPRFVVLFKGGKEQELLSIRKKFVNLD